VRSPGKVYGTSWSRENRAASAYTGAAARRVRSEASKPWGGFAGALSRLKGKIARSANMSSG
jgi:hypothetical protein